MTDRPHPLDPATADEYLAGRKIIADAGLLADPVRFAYYGLEEPPKQDVLGASPADRRLRAYLLNLDSGDSADVVVSLNHGSVVSARVVDTAAEGQLPIIDSEYHLVEEIVAADPEWRVAGGAGPARADRHEQDPDRPDHRRSVPGAGRGRRPPDGPGACLLAGGRA